MALEGYVVRQGRVPAPRTPGAGARLQRERLARRPGAGLRETGRAAAAAEARLETARRQTDVLAHDLNNLLNVILAANEAIAAAPRAGVETVELARMSQDAAEKAGALIRSLSAGDFNRAPPVDGGQAILSVARLARLSTPPSVMVEAQAAEEPLPCAVDSAGLESALLNLAVNAGHAMPAGGVLGLSATRVALGAEAACALGLSIGAYVALSVIDTGVGMSPEVLARATEPHFTTRRGDGGTGLGLASVRTFAERAGGRLALKSEVGRGTSATLYLPLA